MAISNHIKLGINFRENKNEKSTGYGKMHAEIDRRDGLTTRGLAAHLAEHNFGMGEDAIYAVLNRLSKCLPELLAQGIPVKLDGLGQFYVTVASKGVTPAKLHSGEENASSMISGVRIRFRPEGVDMNNLTSKSFLRDKVSLISKFIVETIQLAGKNVTQYTSIEEWKNTPLEP